jgi:hypothetical protein
MTYNEFIERARFLAESSDYYYHLVKTISKLSTQEKDELKQLINGGSISTDENVVRYLSRL